jgi:BlaI family transcriptional regulator, penicillinase repressor
VAINRPSISETELEVLRVLWEYGPGTVRDVNAVLRRQRRRRAYTTVLTLLQRLQTKGYVTSDKSGLAHVFCAAVSREDLIKQRLILLAEELCEGTASPLVHALVAGNRFSAAEIEQFRKLVDELSERQTKFKSRGSKGT